MSITIHFGGQLASLKDLDALLSMVTYYAEEHDWPYSELKENAQTKLEPWEKGVSLQSNTGVESINIYFDDSLTLGTFCKTQFGGVEAHIEVIEFLHAIEGFFKNFWVEDEGDYWKTKDQLLLKKKMDLMAKILDDVEKSIKEQKEENKWKYN
ncbi:hypothetical protein IV494_10150 [Kaistella sp. G5-32]|uniref:Uncharacterized protein n=1 Tax=Kaistella gelatinilytica TaxID=2787636 RepID=A0ABS0FCW1_9FLAO|nr:hypothetical protein [Kaistella gelatinilytica]MBF8457539.1 hypothetical protein [Kaistella gelatinilytica]